VRFLTKAIRRHGIPEKITIDGSGAHAASIRRSNKTHGTAIVIRQVKYLMFKGSIGAKQNFKHQ
jgi:putative transposase